MLTFKNVVGENEGQGYFLVSGGLFFDFTKEMETISLAHFIKLTPNTDGKSGEL